MEKQFALLDPSVTNLEKLQKEICNYVKGKPSEYWKTYPVYTIKLKKPVTQEEIEKMFHEEHLWFAVDWEQEPEVDSIILYYDAYQGNYYLQPGDNFESYFDFKGIDYYEGEDSADIVAYHNILIKIITTLEK